MVQGLSPLPPSPPTDPQAERDFRQELEELVAAWIEVAGADRVQLRLEGAAARVAEQAHAARRRT